MSAANKLRSEDAPHKPPIIAAANAGIVEDFETLLGKGNDLWADDAEFEAFLAELRRWRPFVAPPLGGVGRPSSA
ncbi:MAG TPA: hypothetical protein VKS79_19215 [Gemmataceae bacterium]|nr:hypothetical protein [Gemmataceae bacterium]